MGASARNELKNLSKQGFFMDWKPDILIDFMLSLYFYLYILNNAQCTSSCFPYSLHKIKRK